MTELLHTPLFALHEEFGAKMVPFAGYAMPVQYGLGVMKEHIHTRTRSGLFDVSHMGQVIVSGAGAAEFLESLIPIDVLGLDVDRQRYGFFTNDAGGILDDLMVTRRADHFVVVVNAACKTEDFAHLSAHAPASVSVIPVTDRALVALQGPASQAALAALNPAVADMSFMDVATVDLIGAECWVSRSGYTGEDGYEISVPDNATEALARRLIADPQVEPIGLGARDSLRLEAGLCLYGHDITDQTTPTEGALNWAIQNARRSSGARAGGFPGANIILVQIDNGASRKRIGLLPEGRAPMREGVEIFASVNNGATIGTITSGGFGPTVERPVAMALIDTEHTAVGTTLYGELRGKRLPLAVTKLPFRAATFKR